METQIRELPELKHLREEPTDDITAAEDAIKSVMGDEKNFWSVHSKSAGTPAPAAASIPSVSGRIMRNWQRLHEADHLPPFFHQLKSLSNYRITHSLVPGTKRYKATP